MAIAASERLDASTAYRLNIGEIFARLATDERRGERLCPRNAAAKDVLCRSERCSPRYCGEAEPRKLARGAVRKAWPIRYFAMSAGFHRKQGRVSLITPWSFGSRVGSGDSHAGSKWIS